MKKSYGYRLHFDCVYFRWDENQYAYRKITLDDLIQAGKQPSTIECREAVCSG
ncbi:hypothetical protein [Thalassotalea piscium]|uniref:Uncharacterized protein n=1 Tax=Thalassotalea piscium TaxID=1230533 RepID=A0A7X0NEI4_9GAMM|nr:hypothetical protein [Thalassotalea piscium]MBB6541976.1 hypothetical protein [Thalassotalea piscium]